MKTYKVIKRNGEVENLDILKIKRVIQNATMGLKTNPLVLESQVQLVFKGEMTSREIHHSLINTALKLTNVDNDENMQWRFVAARLLLMDIFKDAAITRGLKKPGYNNYYKFVKTAVSEGLYDQKIIKEYSKEEIEEIGNELNVNYDYGFDYAGMNLLATRYLIKKSGKAFELPQEMYLTMALLLALPESKENRLAIAKKIYHATASRHLSLATPIVLNLRKPNGNLSSCFISATNDDLNSIYYSLDHLAQISKQGGGVGSNWSRVRSKGAYIKGVKGASGGVIPWIKLVNDTAIAVNQLGSRAGAITVALDVWHKDIEDFLDMQTENGDQRKKAYDIFPQVVIPDLFMERVKKDEFWTLLDPHEVRTKYNIEIAELWGDDFEKAYIKLEKENLELSERIKARDLIKKILKVVVETGMPYVCFKDSMNANNPNKNSGMIGNANLCVESYSNFSPSKVEDKKLINFETGEISQKSEMGFTHVCNLLSLNLALIDSDSKLEEMVRLSVRILDNALDITAPPVPEAKRHNDLYRILGIGSTGLNDWIVKRGKSYIKSKDIVGELFEKIGYYAVDESCNLSVSRGSYHFYEGSDWSRGIVFGKDKKWFEENKTSLGKDTWNKLISKIKKNGMRNGGLLAIAPNTSTSLLMGCSASILPIFSKFFLDKASKGTVPVIPPELSDKTFLAYIENKNIDQRVVVDLVSEIQKWTDQGVSMELILNLNNGLKAADILNLYMDAWEKKLKTVYYIRSVALNTNKDKEDCVSCAN